VTRVLASDRCSKAGHLLASAVADDGGRFEVVIPRSPQTRIVDGHLRRDLRVTEEHRYPFDQIGEWSGDMATCGCRDNHQINLSDLKRRAIDGDTLVRRISPVRRTMGTL